MPSNEHVAAVVVTHNRRDLLLESLDGLYGQKRPPERVVVVDNASTDGTADAVRERFATTEMVTMSRNAGGAGGFAAGMSRALESDATLLWLMDDDTVPEPDALEALLDARHRYPHPEPPVLVASRVVWTDGRDHPMNTPREKPRVSASERAAAKTAGCVPIRSASFVSCLVDAAAARERGLPIADYFLWNDDFEFTTRLLRGRVGLFCPASVVVHKTRALGSTDADPGGRFFYEVRNKVWLFTRSSGLAPLERLLYAGSTLRRWVRTFARSADRGTLRRGLFAGLTEGVRAKPRDTEVVLAELTQGTGPEGSSEPRIAPVTTGEN